VNVLLSGNRGFRSQQFAPNSPMIYAQRFRSAFRDPLWVAGGDRGAIPSVVF
jgi:hypothetical protein